MGVRIVNKEDMELLIYGTVNSFVFALVAVGFDFLTGYLGLVCLGGAFFIGAGGYISGLLNAYLGWPIHFSIPAATLDGAGFNTLVLLPCLRLRGIYFAMISFMYPLFAVFIIVALNVFGGTEGVSALDPFPNIWFF
jgi:branched-chain amino acid transport system permease protein